MELYKDGPESKKVTQAPEATNAIKADDE